MSYEGPYFGLSELRELRKSLSDARLYIAPVGISEHATSVWCEAHKWVGRLDSLIAETEEYEGLAAVGVPEKETPSHE